MFLQRVVRANAAVELRDTNGAKLVSRPKTTHHVTATHTETVQQLRKNDNFMRNTLFSHFLQTYLHNIQQKVLFLLFSIAAELSPKIQARFLFLQNHRKRVLEALFEPVLETSQLCIEFLNEKVPEVYLSGSCQGLGLFFQEFCE